MKKGLLLTTLLLSSLSFAHSLPNLNSAAQNTFSSTQESLIGRQFYAEIHRTLPLVGDPFVNLYVRDLGQHLIAYSPKPQQKAVFFVIKDNDINAFAGPDGYIGINAGIILVAKTQGELASVMAHELAHVEQRHIARGIEDAKKNQLLGIASILATIAVRNPGSAAAGSAGAFESSMHTSRQFEQEADRIGLEILQKAGFKKQDMANFLQNLAKNKRRTGLEEFEELFASHPSGSHRLAEVSTFSNREKATTATFDYQLIQARTLIDSNPRSKTLTRDLKIKAKTVPQATAVQYAYALSLQRLGQTAKARAIMQGLLKRYPEDTYIIAAYIENLYLSGQRKKALQYLHKEFEYHPDNIAFILFYSRLLMKSKQYHKAVQVLSPYRNEYQQLPSFLAAISYAYGKAGYKVQGYIARAKYYGLFGNYPSAILQLKQAKRFDKKKQYHFQINRLMANYKNDWNYIKKM